MHPKTDFQLKEALTEQVRQAARLRVLSTRHISLLPATCVDLFYPLIRGDMCPFFPHDNTHTALWDNTSFTQSHWRTKCFVRSFYSWRPLRLCVRQLFPVPFLPFHLQAPHPVDCRGHFEDSWPCVVASLQGGEDIEAPFVDIDHHP